MKYHFHSVLRSRPDAVKAWSDEEVARRWLRLYPKWRPQFSGLNFLPIFLEKIWRHCGLWEGPIRTLANPRGPPIDSERAPDEPRELQLVLDPEFL